MRRGEERGGGTDAEGGICVLRTCSLQLGLKTQEEEWRWALTTFSPHIPHVYRSISPFPLHARL